MAASVPNQTEMEEEATDTAAAGVYLPPEILYEILSRLPAKSIASFRCVSKHWQTLLSDRQFLKTQFVLNNRNNHRNKIVFPHRFSTLSIDFCESVTDKGEPIGIGGTLDFRHSNRNFQICGSCNGLILLHDHETCELLVVNPLTHESRKLPPLPITETRPYYVGYGFGYCSNDDDYVVVILPAPNRQLFMFKRNCWKIVENSPLSSYAGCGVFVNGAIHWLGQPLSGYYKRIWALDLAGERFREVEKPEGLKVKNELDENWLDMDVVGGCLCLVNHNRNSAKDIATDIWVMKEYRVRESWTKYLAYTTNNPLQPLFFWNGDESIIGVHEGKLVLCCLKRKRATIIPVVGERFSRVTYREVWEFVESLFSPNSSAVEGPNQVQV